MYFLYSLGGVTFNKCWITLSILNCYSPNFQGFILMKNALNNQVGMLGDMFLWLVANLKQGVIYFIKQVCGNEIMPSVYVLYYDHHTLCFLVSYNLRWSQGNRKMDNFTKNTRISSRHKIVDNLISKIFLRIFVYHVD